MCLSLLGTYNSGHTSEKWNPDLSTLYQILVSVQSQILVDDPMTNEPLSETMAGTAEGAAKTAQYNARLQLMVMRHAMVDMLQHPPPGTQVRHVYHGRVCSGEGGRARAPAAASCGAAARRGPRTAPLAAWGSTRGNAEEAGTMQHDTSGSTRRKSGGA